jgi:dTDP-glucose pyrophosphorylase
MSKSEVREAVIPAAGMGTRLGPFSQAIPKELLPVGNKAVVEHVVDAIRLAGIREITVICAPHKHGISDYLGSGKRYGVDFTYVIQDEQKGLADAVLSAEHAIDGPFAVVLGDNYFDPKLFLKDLISCHIDQGADATLGVAEVEDVTRHGIIKPDGDHIASIVEKPSQDEAPSGLGSVGIYVFERDEIFDAIKRTKPGYKGEYQLTDSINVLVDEGKKVLYKKIDGIHIDVGTPKDLMLANAWWLKNNEAKLKR